MGIMLSRKLRQSQEGVLQHWCPGCDRQHSIFLVPQGEQKATWHWNGNVDSPTFSPSVHIQLRMPIAFNDEVELSRQEAMVEAGLLKEVPFILQTDCHYWITDGQISYCGDTPHSLSGLTVALPDWPERYLQELSAQTLT